MTGIRSIFIKVFAIISLWYLLWIFFNPSDQGLDHLSHHVSAHFLDATNYIREKYSSACEDTPDFEKISDLKIANPSFEQGIVGWTPDLERIGGVAVASFPRRSNSHQKYFTVGITTHTNDGERVCLKQNIKLDSKLYDLIDNETLLIVLETEVLAPISRISNEVLDVMNKSLCSTRNHFCSKYFSGLMWSEIVYMDEQLEEQGSLKTRYVADFGGQREMEGYDGSKTYSKDNWDAWMERSARSIIPRFTRSVDLFVCGRKRGIHSSGGIDNIKVHVHKLNANVKYSSHIIKNPLIYYLNEDEIGIMWEFDSPFVTSKWGYNRSQIDNNCKVEIMQIDTCHYRHLCRLKYQNYKQNQNFGFYKIQFGNRFTHIRSFKGIPTKNSEEINILMFSDNQYGSSKLIHLLEHAKEELESKLDLVLIGGDVVNDGSLVQEWGRFFFSPIEQTDIVNKVPIVYAHGNHDGEHSLTHAYTDPTLSGRDYYAFTTGFVRIVVLNTNANKDIYPAQFSWLKSELRSQDYSSAHFKIILFHTPPYTEYWELKESYNGETFVRAEWMPLFEEYKPTLLVNGHTHGYSRGMIHGIHLVIIGGAGGMMDDDRVFDWGLFKVHHKQHHFVITKATRCVLSLIVYSSDGDVIDQLNIPASVNCE